MKISLNWLTDYVDVSMSAAELGAALTRIGISCEEIIESSADVVLDLEVTSNRPDCLGHLGVAREVAAMTGAAFRPPAIGELPISGRACDLVGVTVEDGDLCPRYTARVLRGVKVGPSPSWMVERLEAVGLRGINNVVDVTNYVMMEYSQPLHSFDYDKLADHAIVVRRAGDGEMLVSIDQTRCHLDRTMLVIADAQKCVAIAGVMGALNTEVSESTTNVLIEAARFDPLSVRKTSRKLALMSESNYRFERGVDPVGVEAASLRACQLILQLGGGTLAEGVVDVWARPCVQVEVALRPQRCNALLGIDVPAERQAEILRRLGLSPRMEGGRIVCRIPSHRADLAREADLIEEIARLEGYDKIPVAGEVTHRVATEGRPQRVRRRVVAALSACGFDEAMTVTFIDAGEAELFGQGRPVCADPLVRKTNNALRPTLLPSLLRACKTNQDAGTGEVSLWELACVFPPGPRVAGGPAAGGLSGEYVEIAMVTTRELGDLRGAIEALLADVAPAASLDVRAAAVAGLDEQASAEILMDDETAGVIGLVAANVLDHYGLERGVAAATVRFDALLKRYRETRGYKPIPKFPPVRRDLSLIVDQEVTWRTLSEAIAAVDQPMRAAVDYVTTYRGKSVPDGRKSVTVTLTYRSPEGTLRSEQVDEQVGQVVSALREKLKAEMRVQ